MLKRNRNKGCLFCINVLIVCTDHTTKHLNSGTFVFNRVMFMFQSGDLGKPTILVPEIYVKVFKYITKIALAYWVSKKVAFLCKIFYARFFSCKIGKGSKTP